MRPKTLLTIPALVVAAICSPLAAPSPVQAAVRYVFEDLDVPGAKAGTTGVSAINNRNEVVGSYEGANGVSHGYLYADGRYRPFNVPGATSTVLTGINDAGQLVGTYVKGGTTWGFLDANGIVETLVESSGDTFKPIAVNDLGQVLGVNTAFGPYYTYSDGAFTTLPYGSIGYPLTGFNNIGTYLGYFEGMKDLYTFIEGNVPYTEIGLPSGRTWGYGINDLDQVVGYNNTIIGGTTNAPIYQTNGYLYTNGIYTIIDAPGAAATVLNGINDRGDLIGYEATYPCAGCGQAFVAIRDPSAPEASTWVMMAAGFAALHLMGLRVRRSGGAHGAIAPRRAPVRRPTHFGAFQTFAHSAPAYPNGGFPCASRHSSPSRFGW